jgi:hypothetical protein
MDIAYACKTVHAWHDLFSMSGSRSTPASLPQAVAVIKAYLEREKADGKPIQELEIAEALLKTREATRYVMPFVLSCKSSEALKRRKAMG